MSGTSITVSSGERIYIPHEGEQISSGRSRSIGSPASTESHSGHSSGGSWVNVPNTAREYDIEPSEASSRSRLRSSSRRQVAEAPEVPSRHSSVAPRESEYRPAPQRTRSSRHPHRGRVPSDESTYTLDDYPYAHGHAPPQQRHRYSQAAPPGHGAVYPPTQVGGYPDPFAAQDLVHMPRDHFGYPLGNGFSSGAANPFTPMPAAAATAAYHPQDPYAAQHRPMPQSRASMYAAPPYGGEMYHMQQMMHPGYPMYPGMGFPGHTPSQPASPAPADGQNAKEFEALKDIIKKHNEERLAWEKALIAKAEADAAAKAAEAARVEEEKKRKADIAAASSAAKETAEKKAADDAKKAAEEAEKKLAEAKKAKEDAEQKTKDLEEEKKKNAPAPDASKEPIKFKDAAHRKFSFPWSVCKTWKGMESLIKQAFSHFDVLGEHVLQGHYDLMGPDGEIILPQVWETTVQPGWEIEMVMWPMADVAPAAAQLAHPHDSIGGTTLEELLRPSGALKGKGKNKVKSKDKGKKAAATTVHIPVPPAHLPQHYGMMEPMHDLSSILPGVMVLDDKHKVKGSSSKKASKNDSSFTRWMFGAPPPRRKG